MDEGGPREEDDEGGPRTAALIGLVVILVLVLAGLWLTRQLHTSASLQDCLASGRSNCAPLAAPARR